MKVKELLSISEKLLKRLHASGIRIDDYQYLSLISDYEKLTDGCNKKTYVVARLSEMYGICERKIYKLLSRLYKDC